MFLEQIAVGPMQNFSYLVGDDQTKEAFVVDPGFDHHKILQRAKAHQANITRIFLTHTHSDHINAVAPLKAATGAMVVAHQLVQSMGIIAIDEGVEDGASFILGKKVVKILHTPGHTPEGICLLVNDQWLITGDTLFIGNCGRADLPSSSIKGLFSSLQRLKLLPGALIVCPGHDYGPRATQTLDEERRTNPTLLAQSVEEFCLIP